MKNHRCKGSLANKVSIREDYEDKDELDINGDTKQWRIFSHQCDYNWNCENDYFHEICIAKIEYCPFCGNKLN